MSTNQARFRVATMARVLGVSTSGYYAWRQRPPSARAQADADLTARVRAIHADSRGTYGAPRIHAELAEAGVAVGRKRVARVMRAAGIAGGEPAPRAAHDAPRCTGPAGAGSGRAPLRGGRAESSVGRRHHLRPDAGRLPHLAIVLDVFSRRVVGWAMATHLRTELVVEALEMAVEQRRPEAVVHQAKTAIYSGGVALATTLIVAVVSVVTPQIRDALAKWVLESDAFSERFSTPTPDSAPEHDDGRLGSPAVVLGTPTHNSIDVSWRAVEDAGSYGLNYGPGGRSDIHVNVGRRTAFTVTGLTPETNYYLYVCAHDDIGAGGCSGEYQFTTLAND